MFSSVRAHFGDGKEAIYNTYLQSDDSFFLYSYDIYDDIPGDVFASYMVSPQSLYYNYLLYYKGTVFFVFF